MTDHHHEGLWVRSDVLPTGIYGVSINVGADRSWTLAPDRAVIYAVACARRATEAEHDVAVLSLLTTVGVSDEHAQGLLTSDLWPDRAIDHSLTDPLRFHSGVGRHRKTRAVVPVLRMELDGKPAGELSTADLRDHAMGVLQVVAAIDLDAALLRCLRGTVGLEERRARATVAELGEHWPADEAPRRAQGGAR